MLTEGLPYTEHWLKMSNNITVFKELSSGKGPINYKTTQSMYSVSCVDKCTEKISVTEVMVTMLIEKRGGMFGFEEGFEEELEHEPS